MTRQDKTRRGHVDQVTLVFRFMENTTPVERACCLFERVPERRRRQHRQRTFSLQAYLIEACQVFISECINCTTGCTDVLNSYGHELQW